MKVTRQHKNVAEIAIVIKDDKTVWLKANREKSSDSFLRWACERRCDYEKQFDTREAALEAGLKVCPVFYGTAGPRAQISTIQFVYGIGYCGV